MSEMIERVARAIDEAAGTHSEDVSCWYDHARAAIEAMREPSEAMKLAGEEAYWSAPKDEDGCTAMEAAFRAMIATALASEPKP